MKKFIFLFVMVVSINCLTFRQISKFEHNFSQSKIQKLRRRELKEHNKKRALHGSPALKLSNSLNSQAQQWAERIVGRGLRHRGTGGYGQNLYMCYNCNYKRAKATKAWYNEIKDYNFNRPGYSSATGHFTQVVWKGSTYVGFGFAQSGRQTVVVAFYSPAGNYLGQFSRNVKRLR